PDTLCIIGNGAVVDPEQLFKEIEGLAAQGIHVGDRLKISERVHIVFPYHKVLDELREKSAGKGAIGTTKRGIGPAYGDKVSRVGIRSSDLFAPEFPQLLKRSLDEKNAVIEKVYGGTPLDFDTLVKQYREYGERLRPMLTDTGLLLEKLIKDGKKVLFEGAQGTMLDIDHGTYPFVTSSNTIGPNMLTGSGYCLPGLSMLTLPADQVRIVGVVKAYTTRVGEGPFPTELTGEAGEWLRQQGAEFGATTGRPRRCGWLDIAQLRYATRLSGVTEVFLTKLDVLTGLDEIKVGVGYEGVEPGTFPANLGVVAKLNVQWQTFPGWKEDLTGCRKYSDMPENARRYVDALQELFGVPIRTVSVGPKRDQVLSR
ncbi:MAG: adenylosuccinate synthase, partial [Planctomycetota bacterium]